ncbi:hypothetical protein ABTZ03_17440 [Kitasatospora sp. NPDC096077]|uniref:hypothetical protein n=1 Tax=Kitasatospora sp. NPDC096077 TaxID=3155544 RepID=UPI00331E3D2D
MTTEPEQPPSAAAEPPPPPAPPTPPVPSAPPVPPVPFAAVEQDPTAGPTPYQNPYADVLSAGPEAAPRAPRRPRPVLLSVCALVAGAVAGAGVGYGIQAQRPPTPLPPLQVALPAYPAAVVDPTAFAAGQPAPPAIEGDLTKLLVSAPAGSAGWGDYPDKPSWMSIGELAERKSDAAYVFKNLARTGFRRAAEVDWMKDDIRWRVTLTQYTPDHIDKAEAAFGKPFADDANGGYWVESEPSHWSDTNEPYYYGKASAQRGTVLMTVEVFSPNPVDSGGLKSLAKQQWERLV